MSHETQAAPVKAKVQRMAQCQKCGRRWFLRTRKNPRQCTSCWSNKVTVSKVA